MDVFLHNQAEKFLNTLDRKIQPSIKEHLKTLSKEPYSKLLDIKKLKGMGRKPDIFRLRVGEYRIIYFIQGNEILVTDIIRREAGYNL
ncbi:MAG: type II toxin-antitoxin system RelE/ParE family toxin [Candidatus Aenigmarchaeota archaeon]|nr:type II toxin-antitoxin system RelE/ParE family toxin [Candidatus Aenigmarchaeota archaeon]